MKSVFVVDSPQLAFGCHQSSAGEVEGFCSALNITAGTVNCFGLSSLSSKHSHCGVALAATA